VILVNRARVEPHAPVAHLHDALATVERERKHERQFAEEPVGERALTFERDAQRDGLILGRRREGKLERDGVAVRPFQSAGRAERIVIDIARREAVFRRDDLAAGAVDEAVVSIALKDLRLQRRQTIVLDKRLAADAKTTDEAGGRGVDHYIEFADAGGDGFGIRLGLVFHDE